MNKKIHTIIQDIRCTIWNTKSVTCSQFFVSYCSLIIFGRSISIVFRCILSLIFLLILTNWTREYSQMTSDVFWAFLTSLPQRCCLLFKSGWASSNVMCIICPPPLQGPGWNRVKVHIFIILRRPQNLVAFSELMNFT